MFNNILGSFGGAGIGSMLGNFLSNRNRGGGGGMGEKIENIFCNYLEQTDACYIGGGGYPMGGGGYSGGGSNYDYQGGGAYPAGPQPGYGDNSGQGGGGGGLYPSAKVKSEGRENF